MGRRSLWMRSLLAGVLVLCCLQYVSVAQMASLDQTTLTATPSPTPIPPKKYFFPIINNNQPGAYLPPAGTNPSYATSVYMLSVDSTKLYNLGCQVGSIDKNFPGSRDTLVILDFGSPKKVNTEYGTDLFWMGPVPISQITGAVENFGRGYYICADTDRVSQVFVGIGTTNYGSMLASSTSVAYGHGAAWAQMVNNVNGWFKANGYASQVHAVGAIDVELSWSSPAIAKAWVNGYDSANLYDYYDYGTLDGCATRSDPNRNTCANGWTREDAWYKAFGTRPGFPVPEIYNTYGANAQQWALLSLYSVNTKGYKIEFPGVMTQYQACVQAPAGQCAGINNTPDQGWTQLVTELNKDSRTAYSPRWSTDIRWGYEQTADAAPANLTSASPVSAAPSQSLDSYIQALAQPGLDLQMQDSLTEKKAISAQVQADQAYGMEHAAPKDPALAPEAPWVTDSGFPMGIFEGAGGAAHAWEGSFINHWQGMVGGQFVIVSAGSPAEDPSTGLVMLMRVSGDRTQFSRKFFTTPQNAGPVRVSEASGSQVILSAENGARFTFNIDTEQFQ